ncbi:hypothetical protein VNI00_009555 [Paramarasmius palmivorus]|uniref:Uncharacterized protein n=1 Tax=Paramarasmius palmivorus TaxID=297713 RepID=A0AAW0CNP9_9AGAR
MPSGARVPQVRPGRSMWPYIKLPCRQIEDLDWCETDNLDSVHAFQLATTVKHATVMSRINPSSWLLPQRNYITNTSLQSLAYYSFVGHLFQQPSEHICRAVRFLALTELTLAASAEFGSLREAVNLVRHSACRLEVLDIRRLYRAEIIEDDFKDLLECTENHLKNLTLHVSFISGVWTSIAEDTINLLADKLADGSAAKLGRIFLKLDPSSYRDAAEERSKLTNSRMVQRLGRVVKSGKLGLELCVHSEEDGPTR